MQALLAFGLIITFAYYLLARASLTRPLWSRYRGRLASLMACPACSGFWLGLAFSHWCPSLSVNWYDNVPVETPFEWAVGFLLSGLVGGALCGILYGALHWGLAVSSIEEDEHGQDR